MLAVENRLNRNAGCQTLNRDDVGCQTLNPNKMPRKEMLVVKTIKRSKPYKHMLAVPNHFQTLNPKGNVGCPHLLGAVGCQTTNPKGTCWLPNSEAQQQVLVAKPFLLRQNLDPQKSYWLQTLNTKWRCMLAATLSFKRYVTVCPFSAKATRARFRCLHFRLGFPFRNQRPLSGFKVWRPHKYQFSVSGSGLDVRSVPLPCRILGLPDFPLPVLLPGKAEQKRNRQRTPNGTPNGTEQTNGQGNGSARPNESKTKT